MKNNRSVLFEIILETDEFLVTADILSLIEDKNSLFQQPNYSHTLIAGTYKINKQQKLHLAFISHVLSMTQDIGPVSSVIVTMHGKSHRIKFITLYKEVLSILTILQKWRILSKLEMYKPATWVTDQTGNIGNTFSLNSGIGGHDYAVDGVEYCDTTKTIYRRIPRQELPKLQLFMCEL